MLKPKLPFADDTLDLLETLSPRLEVEGSEGNVLEVISWWSDRVGGREGMVCGGKKGSERDRRPYCHPGIFEGFL